MPDSVFLGCSLAAQSHRPNIFPPLLLLFCHLALDLEQKGHGGHLSFIALPMRLLKDFSVLLVELLAFQLKLLSLGCFCSKSEKMLIDFV